MSELKKFDETHEAREIVRDFFDWLGTQQIVLCVPVSSMDCEADCEAYYTPQMEGIENLLLRYFNINPVTLESERRAILVHLRAEHDNSRA